jgi:2-amino-4-hydroxy-6-hydroxymethyldihydropteridine diphosphokinase
MALIVGLGSNLGNKVKNLEKAEALLRKHFSFVAKSRLYLSPPVDYLDQPDFINQVMEFQHPELGSERIMDILLKIENEMGRKREIPRGPRIIDLDLLFLAKEVFKNSIVEIPHPRLFERSFVVLPLMELPYYSVLKKEFNFPSFHSTLTTLN